MNGEKLEKFSGKIHEIWADWMKYVFSQCNEERDPWEGAKTGNLIIPRSKVKKWKRQINTPYNKLSESEKQSDRDQVHKFKHLIDES